MHWIILWSLSLVMATAAECGSGQLRSQEKKDAPGSLKSSHETETTAGSAHRVPARILKVLPHLLDLEGRHTLSPSLYERDAYQAYLRRNPALRSGLRFDVQWKAIPTAAPLTLRLELRTSQAYVVQPLVLETPVKGRRGLSRWTSLSVTGETYQKMGQLIAWRATLWEGDRLLTEQKSYLW